MTNLSMFMVIIDDRHDENLFAKGADLYILQAVPRPALPASPF